MRAPNLKGGGCLQALRRSSADAEPEQQGHDAEKHAKKMPVWSRMISESIRYFEDEPGQRSDEARRIAANIAKLPELLR